MAKKDEHVFLTLELVGCDVPVKTLNRLRAIAIQTGEARSKLKTLDVVQASAMVSRAGRR